MTDKRGKLNEEVFAFKITKDKKVLLYFRGKQIMTLKDEKALAFIDEITDKDGKEAQLIMAKATGHFKHGNERQGGSR